MNRMSMMVEKGRACVELWYQATEFTRLHMRKNGNAKRLDVRITFHTQLWPPSFRNRLAETKPETQEVKA